MSKWMCFLSMLWVSCANAQTNSWQPWQPYNMNFINRTAASPIFEVGFGSSIVPEIGSAGTFARASTHTYGDSLTSLDYVTSGNPAVPAFPYGGAGTDGGYDVYGPRKNWIQYSENLGNAIWTDVGTPTAALNPGTTACPDGTNNANYLVSDAADEGVTQDSGEAAASTTWVFSAYVATLSSTLAGKLAVQGVGGTPETTNTAFTATTTWQRVVVAKAFSASATGDVQVQITLDAAGILLVWGLQLEKPLDASYGGATLKPSQYIKTEGAVAVTADNVLYYPSANISGALTRGSISVWVNTAWGDGSLIASQVKAILSMSEAQLCLYTSNVGTTAYLAFTFGSGGTQIHSDSHAITAGAWRHYIVTWDNSGAAISSQIFYNGALVATESAATPTTPTAANVYIGKYGSAYPTRTLDGIISNLKWYNKKLSSGQVSTIYNAEKGSYGL